MRLRIATAITLVALASGAFAQLNSVEEQNLDQAFQYFTDPLNAGGYPGLKLQMDGTQTIGTTTSTFSTTIYWYQGLRGGRPADLINAEGSEDGVPLFKIVGDGTTLWAHDLKRNEYLSSRYGTYAGAQPETYRSTLFKALNSLVKGRYSHAVRFLNETYGWDQRPTQFYRSWMPGVKPVDNGEGIAYQIGSPVRRRLSFDYSMLGGGKRLLTRIEYLDLVSLGAANRELAWQIGITPITAVPAVSFDFTPPVGARPISGIRSVTGT